MGQASKLVWCFLGVALMSGGPAVAGSDRAATRPQSSASSAAAFDVGSPPSDFYWTPLPSRYASPWSATDMMRIEWDRESRTWGMPTSGLSPLAVGVFGARLPSDRPLQITRADGSVMLMLGPEGMEFLTARLGADGRFHLSCGPDPTPPADAAAPLVEK
jgi:hypothetical protein